MRNVPTLAGLQRLLALVLLLPFVLLTLIPAHVMPGRTADGTLTMVLCSDGFERSVTVDLATGQPIDESPLDADARCDWAAGQVAVVDLAQPALLMPMAPLRAARLQVQSNVLADATATGLPPATGPPALI